MIDLTSFTHILRAHLKGSIMGITHIKLIIQLFYTLIGAVNLPVMSISDS